jgi:hypothetical protein
MAYLCKYLEEVSPGVTALRRPVSAEQQMFAGNPKCPILKV